MAAATSNQFLRMYAPTPTLSPNIMGFWVMWPVHLLTTILSFYWLGYYVVPRFWNQQKWLTFFILFNLYWLASSYSTVYLFEFINEYLSPAPTYITTRIPKFLASHWYDFFIDPSLLFYNWAFGFSYVLIPLLIKGKRDETKKGALMMALEQEKLMMELSFLRSQINPHFLFNAFNNLYTLIRKGDKIAATVLADLSDILRYALYKTSANTVPLRGELLFLANYIRLESIRFSENKFISCELSGEPEDFGIPPMVIIPFIENAFKHGLSPSLEKASLKIDIQIDSTNERLKIHILNSKQLNYEPSKEGGIGIANVRKRLDLLMGDGYSLELQDRSAEFSVFLKIPLIRLKQEIQSMDEEPLPFPFYYSLATDNVTY